MKLELFVNMVGKFYSQHCKCSRIYDFRILWEKSRAMRAVFRAALSGGWSKAEMLKVRASAPFDKKWVKNNAKSGAHCLAMQPSLMAFNELASQLTSSCFVITRALTARGPLLKLYLAAARCEAGMTRADNQATPYFTHIEHWPFFMRCGLQRPLLRGPSCRNKSSKPF